LHELLESEVADFELAETLSVDQLLRTTLGVGDVWNKCSVSVKI
jgi:hypothetical protein